MLTRESVKVLARRILPVALLVIALAALAFGIASCASADNAAARRAAAEASIIRAETEAAAERSAIRINEQNAAHQRTLDLLPFVLTIGGGLLLAGGLGFLVWDIRATRMQQQAADPALLALLERQERLLLEIERETWRAIAASQRAALPTGGDVREVVIYPESR